MKTRVCIALAVVTLLLLYRKGHRAGSDRTETSGNAAAADSSPARHQGGKTDRAEAQAAWRLPFSLPPRLDDAEMKRLLRDPRRAVESQDPDQQWAKRLAFLSAWAELDPEAAAAWVDQQEGGLSHTYLAAVAAGIMGRPGGPEQADAFLARHENDERLLPKHRGSSLRREVFQLVGCEETIAPAMEYIRTHPEESLAERLVTNLATTDRQIAALNYFSAKGVKFEFHYADLAEMLEAEPESLAEWSSRNQPDLLEDLVSSWHLIDKGQAPREWIENSLLDPARKDALRMQLERHASRE